MISCLIWQVSGLSEYTQEKEKNLKNFLQILILILPFDKADYIDYRARRLRGAMSTSKHFLSITDLKSKTTDVCECKESMEM